MKNFARTPILALLIAITLVFSCKKDFLEDNTCNVSNPLEDLAWLKDTTDDLIASPDGGKYSYISMAKYNRKTVFIMGYCDPAANWVTPVLNCSGDRIGLIGEISYDSLDDMKTIWKSENSECISK